MPVKQYHYSYSNLLKRKSYSFFYFFGSVVKKRWSSFGLQSLTVIILCIFKWHFEYIYVCMYDILHTSGSKKTPLAEVETRRCWLQPPWSNESTVFFGTEPIVFSPPPGAFRHTENSCLMPCYPALAVSASLFLAAQHCAGFVFAKAGPTTLWLGFASRAASESQGGWRTWLCPSSWLVWRVTPVGGQTEMLFLQFILCQL